MRPSLRLASASQSDATARSDARQTPPARVAAQLGQRLVQQNLGLGIATTLPDVGQVRLVGSDDTRCRRVVPIAARRLAAAGAFPQFRNLRLEREDRLALVALGAEIGDPGPLGRLAPIVRAQRGLGCRCACRESDCLVPTRPSPRSRLRGVEHRLVCECPRQQDLRLRGSSVYGGHRRIAPMRWSIVAFRSGLDLIVCRKVGKQRPFRSRAVPARSRMVAMAAGDPLTGQAVVGHLCVRSASWKIGRTRSRPRSPRPSEKAVFHD